MVDKGYLYTFSSCECTKYKGTEFKFEHRHRKLFPTLQQPCNNHHFYQHILGVAFFTGTEVLMCVAIAENLETSFQMSIRCCSTLDLFNLILLH
jgi:hypothetical protein